jgi:hypothetical protein
MSEVPLYQGGVARGHLTVTNLGTVHDQHSEGCPWTVVRDFEG